MKQVDELIRGELSAIQSYDVVLNKINDVNEKQRLSTMRMDHEKAVDILKRYAGNGTFEVTETSGPWGAFTQAFAGGASLFGDKAAVQALKIGEEHGINEYREALENGEINLELKQVIQSELIPQQEKHISVINTFLQ